MWLVVVDGVDEVAVATTIALLPYAAKTLVHMGGCDSGTVDEGSGGFDTRSPGIRPNASSTSFLSSGNGREVVLTMSWRPGPNFSQ